MEYSILGSGTIPSPYDIRDYRLDKSLIPDESSMPVEFLLDPVFIKNQGNKSTCIPHVLSEILEYHHYKDTHRRVRFSTQFINGMRDDSDYDGKGMSLRDGLKCIQKYGDVPYEYLPGNDEVKGASFAVRNKKPELLQIAQKYRIKNYYKIKSNAELKYALMHHGPVIVSIKLYTLSYLDENWKYCFDSSESYSSHTVMVLGWVGNQWLLQNSWSTRWGSRGCFYLDMDKGLGDIIFEAYGVTDYISDLRVKSYNDGFCKWFNGVVNRILCKLK